VEADVSLERIGQIRAEGRMGGLVGKQLGLGGDRQTLEVVPAVNIGEAGAPEGIGLQQAGEALA
jgi:hypothetical protein